MKKFLSLIILIVAMAGFSEKAEAGSSLIKGISISTNDPSIYLGWINPDGVKPLSSPYEMIFTVRGVRNSQFTVKGKFHNQKGSVFINGNNWSYIDQNHKNWTFLTSSNFFAGSDFVFNQSDGRAYFKLIPGYLFAAPNAPTGFYNFEVELTVSYTSF